MLSSMYENNLGFVYCGQKIKGGGLGYYSQLLKEVYAFDVMNYEMRNVFVFLLIGFFLTTSSTFGQIVEFDTLNQSSVPIEGPILISDTTLVSIALPVGIKENQLFSEFKSRLDSANYDTPDYVVLRLNINSNGELTKIVVLKGKEDRTISECIRVAKTFQKWKPAVYEFEKQKFIDDISIDLPIILKK